MMSPMRSLAVSRLGQYSQHPTEGAYKAMTRVLGYLAGTVNFNLQGYVDGGHDSIEVFCDSDHGGDKHLTTRSQSGGLITLNGVPVHWRSARQPVTALSSAEAEIYALTEAVRKWGWKSSGLLPSRWITPKPVHSRKAPV